uniref:Uncharacterized protein n=1 Tax=Arundo donax TaxID=35708 RepID=A0A0A9GLL4_ARUDO
MVVRRGVLHGFVGVLLGAVGGRLTFHLLVDGRERSLLLQSKHSQIDGSNLFSIVADGALH